MYHRRWRRRPIGAARARARRRRGRASRSSASCASAVQQRQARCAGTRRRSEALRIARRQPASSRRRGAALAAQRELTAQVISVDDFAQDLGASLLQPSDRMRRTVARRRRAARSPRSRRRRRRHHATSHERADLHHRRRAHAVPQVAQPSRPVRGVRPRDRRPAARCCCASRSRPTELDEVILGCAAPSVDEVNIGRVAALRMGCGQKVPGWTVMRNCASGMQALDSGDQQHPRRPLEPRARRRRRCAVARAAAVLRRDGAVVRRHGTPRRRSASAPRCSRSSASRYLAPVIGIMKGPDRSDRGPADGPDRGEPRVPLRHHARARWTRSPRAATSACSPRRRGRPLRRRRSRCRCTTATASSTRRTTACASDSTPENLAKLQAVLRPQVRQRHARATARRSPTARRGCCSPPRRR